MNLENAHAQSAMPYSFCWACGVCIGGGDWQTAHLLHYGLPPEED